MKIDLSTARPSSDGWFWMNCPLCPTRAGKDDHRESFGLRGDTGYFHCFRCGAAGFVEGNALRMLPKASARKRGASAIAMRPPEGYVPLYEGPSSSSIVALPARDYLSRRVPRDLWRTLQIGAVFSGYYAGRVIVPVLAEDGAWIGWVARDWTGFAERPYLYPRGMSRAVLWNDVALRVETETPVFLVEGVFDAIAHWPDAVAALGKPSRAHTEALSVARRPVVVVLDGDAHREGWALAMRLRMDVRAGSVRLPSRVDPDEVSRETLLSAGRIAIASEDGEAVLSHAIA